MGGMSGGVTGVDGLEAVFAGKALVGSVVLGGVGTLGTTLHVACCMLNVACCMLHVACCMLHVAF